MLHLRRPEDRGRADSGWLDRRRRAARRYFALLASRDGRNESLRLRQDVNLWMALMDPGETRVLLLRPGRRAWIHVVRGSITVNGSDLAEGEAASMSDERVFTLIGRDRTEVLLFDLG